jgi:hypothetical protein
MYAVRIQLREVSGKLVGGRRSGCSAATLEGGLGVFQELFEDRQEAAMETQLKLLKEKS